MVLCDNSIRCIFVRTVIALCVVVRLLFCCIVLALVRGKNEVVVLSSSSRGVFYFFSCVVLRIFRALAFSSPAHIPLHAAASPR